MDLYGDKGNAEVLRVRAQKRGIETVVDTCTIGQAVNINEYDLFFLGGGADKEQNLIFEDLIRRRDGIKEAMDNHTAFLLICGGYQLFGRYYKDQDGNVVEGLGFFDYYTEATSRSSRCIGNIAVETTMDGETFKAVGFENHVLVNGKIVLEGDAELADKIDREGYDWIYKEYNVQPAAAEEVKKVSASIGTCAVRQASTAEAKK